MKIGVCVPCYYAHIRYLGGLLMSIENQTLKPHIVSISISGVTDDIVVPTFTTTFPLKITTTDLKKNAGQNRNIAVDQIKDDIDIITFFDADDFMHPKRLEIIDKAFKDDTCDVFMHGYWTCLRNLTDDEIIEKAKPIQISEKILSSTIPPDRTYIHVISDDSGREIPVVNGHISLRVSIFATYRVHENAIGFEDSLYTKNLFDAGFTIKFTPDVLSIYRFHGSR